MLIVIGQPIIKPVISRLENKIKTQMLIGIVIFSISYIVVSFAASFTMFIVAMVIVTFGEMFVWPAVPTIASQLSPKGREGFYQGIVNSFATMGRMFGPFIGGILADQYGMQVMLFILTAFMIIPIITSLLYDRPIKKAGSSTGKPLIGFPFFYTMTIVYYRCNIR